MSLTNKIENFWYLQPHQVRLLMPINSLLCVLTKLKRKLYKKGVFKTTTFQRPVIVVGNISVGGVGKTPFVAQLVLLLAKNNIRTGIVSRGYKASIADFPHKVSQDDSATLVGDEAFMLSHTVDVPLVIDPNRSRAVDYLIKTSDVDLIISDDGLQHYKMDRQLELVLFDGERGFGNQLILPFGPLREAIERLNETDLVIGNGEDFDGIADSIVKLKNISLVQLTTREHFSLDEFTGVEVVGIAGIGNPNRFFKSLRKVCKIEKEISFPDHHNFSISDFEQIEGDTLIMTEKDASKCYPFAQDNWYFLKIEMQFDAALESRLMNLINPLIK